MKGIRKKVPLEVKNKYGLTETEERLLAAIREYDSVKMAAERVGIGQRQSYNILYKLRKRYLKYRLFVNYIDSRKRTHDHLRAVLVNRQLIRKLKEEEAMEKKVAEFALQEESEVELS